jgi:predicted nucleic acid-binding Zn ribbon protein
MDVKMSIDMPTYECPKCHHTFTVIGVMYDKETRQGEGLYIRPAFCPYCGKKLNGKN